MDNDLVFVDGLFLIDSTKTHFGLSLDHGYSAPSIWLEIKHVFSSDLEFGYEGSVVIPRWFAEKYSLEYTEYVDGLAWEQWP